jgi:hypothetical protein
MSRTDEETPRSIAIVGLIMLLLTVLGYVALGVVLKMNGYPKDPTVRWTPIAVNLRQHGHWSLAVSLLWVICAIIADRVDRGIVGLHLASAVGAILMCIILFLFLYAIAVPFTRPLLISIPKEKSLDTQQQADRAPAYPPPR